MKQGEEEGKGTPLVFLSTGLDLLGRGKQILVWTSKANSHSKHSSIKYAITCLLL